MAGFSKIYAIGGLGGFQGSDGINPIRLQILAGDGDRQWFEARYFDPSIKPLASIKTIVPAANDSPEGLLDACIAFFPKHFSRCRSLPAVTSKLKGFDRLDFDRCGDLVPEEWGELRREAAPLFADLNIFEAEMRPYTGTLTTKEVDGGQWYFAYGSNLCAAQMEDRIGEIPEGIVCRLPGYKLAFDKWSKTWGGLAANIVDSPGDEVWGVAYPCNHKAMAELDTREGGYHRQAVSVVSTQVQRMRAVAYIANDGSTCAAGAPSDDYWATILCGATHHKLPLDYVARIAEIAGKSGVVRDCPACRRSDRRGT